MNMHIQQGFVIKVRGGYLRESRVWHDDSNERTARIPSIELDVWPTLDGATRYESAHAADMARRAGYVRDDATIIHTSKLPKE
jgi:hypothetical protein